MKFFLATALVLKQNKNNFLPIVNKRKFEQFLGVAVPEMNEVNIFQIFHTVFSDDDYQLSLIKKMLRKHVKCCRLVNGMGVGLYRIRIGDRAQRMLTLPLGGESLTLPLFLHGIFISRMHHISMYTVYILLYMHIIISTRQTLRTQSHMK